MAMAGNIGECNCWPFVVENNGVIVMPGDANPFGMTLVATRILGIQ